MSSAVIFKNELRKLRNFIKEIQSNFENKAAEADNNVDRILAEMKPTKRKKIYALITENMKENKERIKRISPELMEAIDSSIFFRSQSEAMSEAIYLVSTTINAYENEKVKNQVNNIYFLYTCLKTFHILTDMNLQVVTQCLGMAVYRNSELIKKNKATPELKVPELNLALSEFFNEDGTFKYNKDIDKLRSLIAELEESRSFALLSVSLNPELKFKLVDQSLKDKIALLLDENNQNRASVNKKEINSPEPLKAIDIEATSYIRKYYKNGELISIPEDLNLFEEMLKRSGYKDNEIRNILSLVMDRIKMGKTDPLTLNLFGFELAIYNQAKSILENLRFNDPDYYVILEKFNELKSVFELFAIANDLDDIDSLMSERKTIINELNEICLRRRPKQVTTDNHFIFLKDENGEPYLSVDLKKDVESANKSGVIALLKRIIKENQGRFRKVYISNSSYQPYEVYNGRGNIFFMEITEGYYLILGADTPSKGYSKINNRIERNVKNINEILKMMQDPDSKMALLLENGTWAEDFLNEPENQGRVLKK